MGYITTVLTAAERRKAGPKNGAQATATVTLDPVGAVTVQVASTPQGQGHRTVLAQVVADVLGLTPKDVRVTADLDTGKDAWSIASGNYSSRFAAAVAGVAQIAATRLRDKLARIAAAQLNVRAEDLVFASGQIASRHNADAKLSFGRAAATSHWAPGTLPDDVGDAIRETAFWTPPQLTAPDDADAVNSSLCHGFIFDFCGVEIDRVTGKLAIDRYVTMHDCGRVLHPGMVEGQVRGGFAQALGAAVYEELSYGDDGAFLAGTFADYLLPTATEIPDLQVLHFESPSPFTPLGAKGVGEGNCMSTPVCLANAVADATRPRRDRPASNARQARGARRCIGEEPPPPAGRRSAIAPLGKPGERTPARRGRGATSARRRSNCLGDAARSRRARVAHPRLARRDKAVGHAFSGGRHARHRPGEGPLQGRSRALRSRRAAGGDAVGHGRRRARQRRRLWPRHAGARSKEAAPASATPTRSPSAGKWRPSAAGCSTVRPASSSAASFPRSRATPAARRPAVRQGRLLAKPQGLRP